jgi:acyl dehydratase
MLKLEDLVIGEEIVCGSFCLSRAEIVAFAEKFDPQPFHLDEAAAQKSYFGGLCASGLHSQAAAIGLMVRAIGDVAVVAGGALEQARFHVPVRPDQTYDVVARWTEARPSRNPARGVACIRGEALDAGATVVMRFGVTYVVSRRAGGGGMAGLSSAP